MKNTSEILGYGMGKKPIRRSTNEYIIYSCWAAWGLFLFGRSMMGGSLEFAAGKILSFFDWENR